jgi:hypothetical protein
VPANRKPEARLDDGGLFQAKNAEEIEKWLTIEGRAAALRDQLRCYLVLARPSGLGCRLCCCCGDGGGTAAGMVMCMCA